MTIARVKRAAEIRGIRFDGKKRFINNMIGYGYHIDSPSGWTFRQADSLEGIYRMIMEFPKLKEEHHVDNSTEYKSWFDTITILKTGGTK